VENLPKMDKSIIFLLMYSNYYLLTYYGLLKIRFIFLHFFAFFCICCKDNTHCIWFFCVSNFFKSGQIFGFHWTSRNQKCCSFRGLRPLTLWPGEAPWPLDQRFCLSTPLGALPQTPHYKGLTVVFGSLQLSGAGTVCHFCFCELLSK